MRVIVDADACPAISNIIKVARACGAQVLLVANETQNLRRFKDVKNVTIKEVASARDAADFAIMLSVRADEVVITNDIGLAAMVLAKGAHAISPRGSFYNNATIEQELFIRHVKQKVRRAGGRTKGPSRYIEDDRERLVEGLKKILCKRKDG